MDVERLAEHTRGIRALARSLLRDEGEVDDVVQEACLAALGRPSVPARGWWVSVVRNLARRKRRSEARRLRRERAAARPERTPPTVEVVERADLHRRLVQRVLDLEEPYRSTLLLRYFDGLSTKEIAARLDVPAGTVSVRIHRGLAQLRGRLDAGRGGHRAWTLGLAPLAGIGPRPSLTAGVAAMSTKKSVALVAILLLAAGLAVVAVTRGRAAGENPPRRSPGSAAAPSVSGTPPAAALPPPVDFARVDRDLDLHGVVVDAEGGPVAGADLSTFWYPWRRAYLAVPADRDVVRRGPATLTARDGSFALRLVRGQRVHLRVAAEGFAPAEISYCEAGAWLRIVMETGVRLTVEAVDEEGRPVPDVRLRLFRYERENRRRRIERRGVTDMAGRFVFEGLPAGGWAYLDPRHDRLGTVMRKRVLFPPAGEETFRVVLPRGRTVQGLVTELATGEPIAGSRISTSWTGEPHVVTDAQGRYEVSGWTGEGAFQLTARADGYVSRREPVGMRTRIDFRLVRGSSVAGRILGSGGLPVAGALLTVWADDPQGELATLEHAESGADGRFRLDGLALGTASLVVMAPGHGRIVVDFAPAPGAGELLDLGDVVLPPPRRVEGRVLLPGGRPAEGVLVTLEGANADRGRLLPDRPAPRRTGGTSEERRTDDLGRFRFADLAPGRYELVTGAIGYKPVTREVVLPATADVTGVDIALAGGHELTVRLEDDSGRPVWGMFVKAQLADDWWLQVMSDASGTARFHADSGFESVELWEFETRYRIPDRKKVPAGATELRIVLEEVGIARGVVLGLDGRPLPQACFEVFASGKPFRQGSVFSQNQGWSDLEGRFRVVTPARGRVDIVLNGFVNWSAGAGRVELPPFGGRLEGVPAGARGLVLAARRLRFDETLRVRVATPDGSPLVGAQVYARHNGKLIPGANVLTDREGKAQLRGLPGARIVVIARAARGDPRAEEWIDAQLWPVLPEGQEVRLQLKEARRFPGIVLDERDEPVAGAQVTLYRKRAPLTFEITGEDGRFELRIATDEPGPFRILAARSDDQQGTVLQTWIENVPPSGKEVTAKLGGAD